MTPEQEFHAHLEKCEQCSTGPFDLCEVGHKLIMATGNRPITGVFEGEPPDIQVRINRQIANLRSKDEHSHDCICAECLVAWDDDAHWPTLLWELPRNTHLYREASIPESSRPSSFKVCGCESEGKVRVCQNGQTPGAAVTRAWVAFTMGSKLFGDTPAGLFTVPGSDSVH